MRYFFEYVEEFALGLFTYDMMMTPVTGKQYVGLEYEELSVPHIITLHVPVLLHQQQSLTVYFLLVGLKYCY